MISILMIAMIGVQLSTSPDTLAERPEQAYVSPSFAKVALMTAGGGALVGAGSGVLLSAVAGGGDQSGFVSSADAALFLGLLGGYVIGSGLGASRAAGVPAQGPLIASFLTAGAGLAVFAGIGDGFDDEMANNDSPWVIGAVSGMLVHQLLTSGYAYRAGRRKSESRVRQSPAVNLYLVNRRTIGASISFTTR